MAAAMCTLISDNHPQQKEEAGQQFAMDPYERRSIEGFEYAVQDAAFLRLPDEIVELILRFTDPNSFASLVILNKRWRRVGQQPQLYAHHLSRCRSFSASHHAISGPLTDADLPRLRSMFAQEVKRNLFDCYLRPRETLIKLVSTSISSSAVPGGEAFHFAFSASGHNVLAYSSSRIYVLDVAAEEVSVKRELKILRRPSTATILDDGSILALLSTDHQVDIYDISAEPPKLTRVVALDHSPRTIALSPDGSVLAIGYEGGVEVYSLSASALPTDKRAVKCDPSDSLAFSPDGTQLLGTTLHSQNPSTVILTAPYYNPVSQMPEESISQLWTTSILFPNSSRDCSHAALLPSVSESEASWTFTYDKVFETFRAVRIDDLRNGTTYFTGPTADSSSATKILPSTLPTANRRGEIVAAGFRGRQIWLYGIPEDLDAAPDIVQPLSGNGESIISTPTSDRRHSTLSQEPQANRIPQWQSLADRLRNTFIQGRNIADLEGSKAMKWVSERQGYHTERLVVAAPGIVDQHFEGEDDGLVPMDGGRLLLLDFQYGTSNGEKRSVTIEVGNTEPQVLEEEQRDMAAEVAIVRRRTIAAQRRTNPIGNLGAVAIPSLPVPTTSTTNDKSPSATAAEAAERLRYLQLSNDDNVSLADEEQEEVFDAPYSHTSPRSGNTLRRAATVAANHRRLHPRAVVPPAMPGMRRTDGTELPHESDADNWVPPPPPYSREPIEPLPEHLRNAILAGKVRTLNRSSPQPSPRLDFAVPGNAQGTSLHRSRSTNSPRPSSLQRTVSDEVTIASIHEFRDIVIPRPSSTPSFFDDIYGVSPPTSPRPPRAAEPVSPETDEFSSPSPNPPIGNTTTQSQSQRLMRATLLQPVSPIPQPIQAWERASTAQRLEDWEGIANSDDVSTINLEEPVQPVTAGRLQAPVPPRPNDDHHMTSFSSSPIPSEHDSTEIETNSLTELPTLTGLQSDISPHTHETLPEVLPPASAVRDFQPLPEVADIREILVQAPIIYDVGLERPSEEQIRRLNSRSGRPPARVLTDPSRRRSNSGSSIYEVPANAPRRRSNSGTGLNAPVRASNNLISEENEGPSTGGGRNRSGSESSTRGSRINMPPNSLDIRHPSLIGGPSARAPLTNLCELGGGSTIDDDRAGNNDEIRNENASELPVFAPQPTRPSYPTAAERRHSGYSTPPRLNTPPRSISNKTPELSSPPRSVHSRNSTQSNNSQTGRQSPSRRRPQSSYNTYSHSSTPSSSSNNRRHSGLAFEMSSSSLPGSVGMHQSGSLQRLDTIRSIGSGSVHDLDGEGFGKNLPRGRNGGGGGVFRSWGRGRSDNGNGNQNSASARARERSRKRESADWSELLGSGGIEGSSGGGGDGNGITENAHGNATLGVPPRDRSKSQDRLSVLGRGKRSDRAVSNENKKRKKEKKGVKCVVM